MALDPEFLALAERFLRFVSHETGCPMIVCDESGTIVKANVKSRIGQVHPGARRIMRGEVDDLTVTAEDERANPLTKQGYNCAVIVDGARLASFGIAGPPEEVRPVARVAALVLAGWVKELRQQRALREVAGRVFAAVDALGARAHEAARGAAADAEASAAAAKDATEKVQRAGKVVSAVQGIAQQSRILSINGAVEATRAGESGRSFGVVSKEMTRLADETKGASGEIQATLAEIGSAIRHVSDRVTRSAASTTAQARTLEEVTAAVGELRGAIARLQKSFGDGARGTA
jgi:Putative sugar diacid recognition/Methyl-accepting chemotaxis protein (MCP) signalling domain